MISNAGIKSRVQPTSVGEMLAEEFMASHDLTQEDLAKLMGVQRKHVNELCRNRRKVTIDTALMLERVFGASAEFWMNLQTANDEWAARNDADRWQRIQRARPVTALTDHPPQM